MGYGLGVDLGTSFTGVAIGRHGRTRIVPLGDDPISVSSLVAVRPPGALLIRESDDTVPVVLGGRPYPAVAVLAEALRTALASVTASEGELPDQVVLTCPAVWGPARRQQFGEVSRRAGLTSVTVVSEPEAAVTALVDGRRLAEDDVVLVYDIGGVTVDMTVVRVTDSGMEILGLPEGADGAGGADFDDLILAHVDRVVGGALSELDLTDPVAVGVLTGVRAECVRAKEALSRSETATVRVIGLAEVVGLADEMEPVRLARTDLEGMIRKPLTSTLVGLRRVLASAGVQAPELTAVVLVGGSSRIPLVSRMLSKSLGRPVLVDEHPQHCVALGAAAIADGTATIADGARRITPGAPPITDSIPTIAAVATRIAAASKSAEGRALSKPAGGKPGKNKSGGKSAANGAADKPAARTPGGKPSAHGPDATAAVPDRGSGSHAASTSVLTATAAAASRVSGPTSARTSGPTSGSQESLVAALQGAGAGPVDGTGPVLSRGAGGHRMPRTQDWRRQVSLEWLSTVDRRWRVIVAAVATVVLAGGVYAVSSLGADPGSDAGPQVVDSPDGGTVPPDQTASEPDEPAGPGTGPVVGLGGQCLDVRGGGNKDGTVVQILRCNGSAGQLWTVAGDGTIRARNKCLQVVRIGAIDPRLQLRTCNGRLSQQWVVSTGVIVNPATSECLDVLGTSPDDGTPVITAGCGGGPGQTWSLRS